MVGTKFEVVEVTDEHHVLMVDPVGSDHRMIKFPLRVTIELGLDPPVLVTYVFDAARRSMVVDCIKATTNGAGDSRGLPARITRAFAAQDLLSEVLRQVAVRVTFPNELALLSPEPAGPISDMTASAVARGRNKSQQGVEMMRRQVVNTYQQVASEGKWPDIYAEVARREKVGRTTVYRYLRDAGVLGVKGTEE